MARRTLVMGALFTGEGGSRAGPAPGLPEPLPPTFTTATTIDVRTAVELQVKEHTWLTANGTVDDGPANGSVFWPPGNHMVGAGTQLHFFQDSSVPVVVGAPPDNASWLRPVAGTSDMFLTYSLILATFL